MLRANLATEDRKSPVDTRLIMQVKIEKTNINNINAMLDVIDDLK